MNFFFLVKIGGVNMYRELKGNENFSDKYPTWIIAYCLDTDSFFATNQRHFFWEYDDEFQCENDAINYFRNHLNEFRNARKEILNNCGGWSIDKDLFLENTKESFSNTNSGDNTKILGLDISQTPDSYAIQYVKIVQARKHKKKRINKKWLKHYGYKKVIVNSKGWKVKTHTDGTVEFVKQKRNEVINISEPHDKFKIINAATNAFIVGKQTDKIGQMMSTIIEARIQNELEQEYKDLKVESQGNWLEDLLKTAKEFDFLEDLAVVPELPKQDISTLKKRIKYCKNPMEKKKLEQELNTLYKEHKRNRRTVS